LFLLFVFVFSKQAQHLQIGMFDWDDNLIRTYAKIYMEQIQFGTWVSVPLSTAEFAEVQQRPDFKTNWRSTPNYLREFSDQQGPNTFLNQVLDASKNASNYGGALPLLKSHLLSGAPISIVTARSHSSVSVRRAFDWFLQSSPVFTPQERREIISIFANSTFPSVFSYTPFYSSYFSDPQNVFDLITTASEFVAVSNPIWNGLHQKCSVPICKAIVVQDIIQRQIGLSDPALFTPPVVISFSDDDSNNVISITNLFKSVLIPKYPNECFRVYNTSDPKKPIINYLTRACEDIQTDVISNAIPRIPHWSLLQQ